MNFSYVFIRRPIGATLLAIGLLLVGATAYVFLPVASLPTVDFPTISVSASRILLIGIVKKNGIMMVDFALDGERRRGLSPREAIHEACLARFRPILMTTIAAALGALPLVIATGPSSELRRPLGITIIGGLLVSQALTLYTTPGDLSVTRVSAPAVRRQKLHLPPPPSRRIVAGFAGSLRDGRSALKKERP